MNCEPEDHDAEICNTSNKNNDNTSIHTQVTPEGMQIYAMNSPENVTDNSHMSSLQSPPIQTQIHTHTHTHSDREGQLSTIEIVSSGVESEAQGSSSDHSRGEFESYNMHTQGDTTVTQHTHTQHTRVCDSAEFHEPTSTNTRSGDAHGDDHNSYGDSNEGDVSNSFDSESQSSCGIEDMSENVMDAETYAANQPHTHSHIHTNSQDTASMHEAVKQCVLNNAEAHIQAFKDKQADNSTGNIYSHKNVRQSGHMDVEDDRLDKNVDRLKLSDEHEKLEQNTQADQIHTKGSTDAYEQSMNQQSIMTDSSVKRAHDNTHIENYVERHTHTHAMSSPSHTYRDSNTSKRRRKESYCPEDFTAYLKELEDLSNKAWASPLTCDIMSLGHTRKAASIDLSHLLKDNTTEKTPTMWQQSSFTPARKSKRVSYVPMTPAEITEHRKKCNPYSSDNIELVERLGGFVATSKLQGLISTLSRQEMTNLILEQCSLSQDFKEKLEKTLALN